MRPSKGFTLIEVLAALIIVSLGMLAVIRAVSQTVSNTDYLRQKTIAHWVAMNKLEEIRLAASPPSNDDSNGDVDMAGITWHWRMTIAAAPGVDTMQRIDIKVAPKDAGEKASIDTISGFYGTAITTAGGGISWDINPTGGGSSSSSSSGGSSSAASSSSSSSNSSSS
jgi:general secretion pathway protein I